MNSGTPECCKDEGVFSIFGRGFDSRRLHHTQLSLG